MRKSIQSLWRDQLLRSVVKNSSYLFSSNGVAIVLSMLQGIFAARLLGSLDFGILAAAVIPYASNVNRLLSFRMSELVVRYLGTTLAEDRKDRASAIVKGAVLVETTSVLLAYLVLIVTAPFAARYIAKDASAAPLFLIYGLYLLTHFGYETASGVLQSFKQFDRLALVNLAHSILTAGLIFAAYLTKGDIMAVLLAYLLGKAFAGVMIVLLAGRQLKNALGGGWWRTPLNAVPDWKAILRFAVSTNLQGTVNLFVRDSESLLISTLRSPTEGGYFTIAMKLINLVMLPIEPFIAPTYAEIAQTITRKDWSLTRRLLKRVSAIAAAWTLPVGIGLAIFGYWLVPLMYGAEFQPAYPALVLLLIGYGFANILHWNRPLLLALGMPGYPLKASAVFGSFKTILTMLLVPYFGFLAESAILSGYFLASISTIVRRGMAEMRRR
ncbi:MAG: oligosaccharide flippase family protein [Anaerolineales bacterium]|nr:oligosaccharide flippase family protein [Anaerolineales bacterium]